MTVFYGALRWITYGLAAVCGYTAVEAAHRHHWYDVATFLAAGAVNVVAAYVWLRP